MWPDVLESSARASLRNALSGVRRALGPTADRVLIAGRETVGLAGEPEAWVDASGFDALIAAGEHEQALALCGGDLLAGLDDDWVLDGTRRVSRTSRPGVGGACGRVRVGR